MKVPSPRCRPEVPCNGGAWASMGPPLPAPLAANETPSASQRLPAIACAANQHSLGPVKLLVHVWLLSQAFERAVEVVLINLLSIN